MDINKMAGIMLKQLKNNKLSIVLIPAPEPKHPDHKIRSAEETNPDWYSKLCSNYSSNRISNREKQDTIIKRSCTITALEKISSGTIKGGIYIERLLPIVIFEYENYIDLPKEANK